MFDVIEKKAGRIATIATLIVLDLAINIGHAATEANACAVYKQDIKAELKQRGYAFVPESCYAEKEGEAGFKFTVTADGNKEVIHCNPEKCQ